MTEYDNNNSGVLFVNEKTKDSQPDYNGKAEVNGKQYKVAGWKRVSKTGGKTFLSLKYTAVDSMPSQKPKEDSSEDDFEEDIGF